MHIRGVYYMGTLVGVHWDWDTQRNPWSQLVILLDLIVPTTQVYFRFWNVNEIQLKIYIDIWIYGCVWNRETRWEFNK